MLAYGSERLGGLCYRWWLHLTANFGSPEGYLMLICVKVLGFFGTFTVLGLRVAGSTPEPQKP